MVNVLSLFDGMSCGRVALERAGVSVNKYYASELDKYAIKVTQKNWPETIQMGDICDWKNWDIDWGSIDLLIGGSPCQGFSFSGKQLAFDDPRSKLFFVYVGILNHIKSINPDVTFLLENVRMKKEYLGVISDHLGVEPVFINSKLVSAQSRPRYYWSNIEFNEPEDLGIYLHDILQEDVDFSDFIISPSYSNRLKTSYDLEKRFSAVNPEKALCMTARQYANWKGTLVSVFQLPRGVNKGGLTANQWEHNNPIQVDLDKPIRRLTCVECERLQTLPDNYTSGVSNAQRYKMIGNGWTVDVIAHIFDGWVQND